MAFVYASLTAADTYSTPLYLNAGDAMNLVQYGTYAATTVLERSENLIAWHPMAVYSTANATVNRFHIAKINEYVRVRCTAYTSGTVLASIGNDTIQTSKGLVNQTVIGLTNTIVSVTDALAYGGTKIFTFDEGRILLLGAVGSIAWSVATDRTNTINGSAALTWSAGTVTASNVSLTSTMVNIIPSTAVTLSAATTVQNAVSNSPLAASAQFDGTSTPVPVFLNASFVTTTDIDADGILLANGTLTLTWVNLGDY